MWFVWKQVGNSWAQPAVEPTPGDTVDSLTANGGHEPYTVWSFDPNMGWAFQGMFSRFDLADLITRFAQVYVSGGGQSFFIGRN